MRMGVGPVTRATRPLKGHCQEWGACGCVSRDSRNSSSSGTWSDFSDEEAALLQAIARYIYIYIDICTYIYVCTCMCVYTYIYLYIYIYVHTYIISCVKYSLRSIPGDCKVCIYIHLYMYLYIYMYMCVYICLFIYVYIYTCIYDIVCNVFLAIHPKFERVRATLASDAYFSWLFRTWDESQGIHDTWYHTCMYIYIHIWINIYICTYTCIHIDTYNQRNTHRMQNIKSHTYELDDQDP